MKVGLVFFKKKKNQSTKHAASVEADWARGRLQGWPGFARSAARVAAGSVAAGAEGRAGGRSAGDLASASFQLPSEPEWRGRGRRAGQSEPLPQRGHWRRPRQIAGGPAPSPTCALRKGVQHRHIFVSCPNSGRCASSKSAWTCAFQRAWLPARPGAARRCERRRRAPGCRRPEPRSRAARSPARCRRGALWPAAAASSLQRWPRRRHRPRTGGGHPALARPTLPTSFKSGKKENYTRSFQ